MNRHPAPSTQRVRIVPLRAIAALRVRRPGNAAVNDDAPPPEPIPEKRQNGYIAFFFFIALLIFGARVMGLLP